MGWNNGTLVVPLHANDIAAPRGEPLRNPLYGGADPWIVHHDRHYCLCQSGPDDTILVHRSHSLAQRGAGSVVWAAPDRGWNCRQIWAPELHRIGGRWFIYYAASDGRNANHRMGVLEALSDDPQGPYRDRGPLYTGDDVRSGRANHWAIDGTAFELRGRLYFAWSGWADGRDIQHLYIAEMSDPRTIATNRVRLCANDDHLWERVSENPYSRGLHEAPAVLHRNGRVFLFYSASGSWQASYKLGMLWMDDSADPLDPRSWHKLPRPVFEPTASVFGVGHCCFFKSPDGREDWMAYHAKRYRHDGWERQVRAQPIAWTEDGMPDLGQPREWVPAPSGEDTSPDLTPIRKAG